MTMGTVHKGATGLLAFSKGLDVISNNVANLNTPGFKRSNVLFRELLYQYQLTGSNNGEQTASQIGNGVAERGTTISFGQGQIQQTGESTHAAINGNGFFVLRDEDATYYTRVGQFEFDEDGYLVSSALETRVAAIDSEGNLTDINLSEFRNNPAQATTEVTFINNLSSSGTDHQIDNLEVIDSLGESHTLVLNFTNNASETDGSWLIDIEDDDGNSIAEDLEIRFSENDSTPIEDFNTVSFTFEPEGAAVTEITLNFGEPGSRTGATSGSSTTNSTLSVGTNNGVAFGALVNLEFESDGTLVANYSNDETADIAQLALGWLEQTQNLRQIGDGLFLAPDDLDIQIGVPSEGTMGEIVGSSVEVSNVELTQEFTDLIIMQRGFQGSSQIVTVANEMMQQLLDVGRS